MLDENEFPFLKADHPALERVQIALKNQLQGELEKVNLELRQKEESLKRVNKEREDVGVQLFGVQQQLVKLQVNLEGSYDEIEASKKQRTMAEERLTRVQDVYETKKNDLDQSFKRMQRINDELNQLNITLRQVEEFNDQMKSEIQITRRGTYKAESTIQDIEKQKSKQDFLIDKMNEDIRQLTETKALYEAQYLAQKQETAAALATMAEAQTEITAIEEEMDRMRVAWKKMLVNIRFRDDVLTKMNEQIRKLDEAELVADSEIRGIKSATRQAQEELQRLTEVQARNAKDMEVLTMKKKNFEIEMEQLKETREVLRASMNHTNKEAARVEQSANALKQQRQNYESAAQQSTAATVALKEKMFDLLSQQKTVDKSTDNTNRSARKLLDQTKGLELELLELNNEIARVEVDVLNITFHNQMLKDRLASLASELTEKERLVDGYEQEISKRHHEIEKRQLKVDRLNKEYDEKKRANAAGGEDAGPLEAEHANLRREIGRLAQEQGRLQSEWTSKQTQLIELNERVFELQKKTSISANTLIVMEQRRMRLEGDLQEKSDDVGSLTKEAAQVQGELDKLNPLVFELQARLAQLTKDVSLQRKDADGELQELNQEAATIEQKLLDIKKAKTALREELAEAERQAMLWERRIQLEEEVQEELGPSEAQQEMARMRKEIHRMELKEEKLKRQKEELVLEMERVIAKKDSIELKFASTNKQASITNTKQASAQLAAKRKLASLDTTIRQTEQTIVEVNQGIEKYEHELGQIHQQLSIGSNEVGQLQSSLQQVQGTVLQKRALKHRSNADIVRFKRAATIFAANSSSPTPTPDESIAVTEANDLKGLEQIIDQELSVAERIQQGIREVYEAHPGLEAPLNVFLEWATTIAKAIGGSQGAAPGVAEAVAEVVEEAVQKKADPSSERGEDDEGEAMKTALVGGHYGGSHASSASQDEEEGEGMATVIPPELN